MNDIEKAIEYIKDPIGKSYEQYEEYEKETMAALEKQIPKKPLKQETRRDDAKIGLCQCEQWWVNEFYKYCPNCGQKLDWEQQDE